MKILFVIRATEHLRYHRSTLQALARCGHHVQLLFDPRFSAPESVKKARHTCSAIGCVVAPALVSRGVVYTLLQHTRDLLSYRRYLVNKDIAHLEPFRRDWKSHLPLLDRIFLKMPFGTRLVVTKWFAKTLALLEHAFPANSDIVRDITVRDPDILVASPINMRGSSAELEYLKAARELNIPTIIQVLSWDNLTVRGLFHIMPDWVLCWNNTQAKEAQAYQQVPKESIRIVGAPVFDAWFERHTHTTPREQFCAQHGLRSEDPIVTYLGSARNIAKDETMVIRNLREALNSSSDARIRNTQIILRVHPGNYKAYIGFAMRSVVAVPLFGSLPDTDEALQLFHDTLVHSVAVVQINTSGAIDAIIDGKPCISLLYPEFAAQQVETIHFKHLMESGASDMPRTSEECVSCVARLLDGNDVRASARERFIEDFIRPRGIHRPAGEWAGDEIEKLAG